MSQKKLVRLAVSLLLDCGQPSYDIQKTIEQMPGVAGVLPLLIKIWRGDECPVCGVTDDIRVDAATGEHTCDGCGYQWFNPAEVDG